MPICFRPAPKLHRASVRRPVAVVAALIMVGMGSAFACDSCGCHLPPELGDAAAGWKVSVFEQYSRFGTLKEEGEKIDNPTGQWMTSSTTQLIVGYRFTPVVSVNVFLPYISRSYERPNNGENERGNVSGIGDASAVTSIRVAHHLDGDSAFNASVQLGIKAPTGNTDQLAFERDGGGDEDPDNAVGGHDLALGSGSWDPMLGANAIGRIERFYASIQGLYTYHTQGDYQYRIANEINATASIGYLILDGAATHVGAQVNLSGESKGLDHVAGEETTDTANHNVFVGPEINALINGSLSALVGVDLPVVENNSDVQLVPTWRVRGAIGWRF